MAMIKTIFILAFLCSLSSQIPVSQEDRIAALELRVDALENEMDDFEAQLAARYNLNRTCITPEVVNGAAMCDYISCKKEGICGKKLKLGSKCMVVCNPGFIATPGKDVTLCKEDGYWTVELTCEIPLVLIGGSGEDSSMELVSLYPSQGCDMKVPDMPMQGESHRRLHNLLYINPEKVLACNGLSKSNEATCDRWSVSTNTWTAHGKPNKGSGEDERECDNGGWNKYFDEKKTCGVDRNKGRYAGQAHYGEGETLILGGMVYDDEGHSPSNSVRNNLDRLDRWQIGKTLGKSRAFFCSAKIGETGVLAIGGLGTSRGGGNTIEKSVEYRAMGISSYRSRNKVTLLKDELQPHSSFTDMLSPRSGHACTPVPGPDYQVLVTGGTKAFNTQAAADGEMFSWKTNSWKKVASMRSPRFGHALVAVGAKVFAIGGDDRNPNNVLDTIEEFDARKNTWRTHGTRLDRPRSDFGYALVPHSMFPGCVVSDPLSE